MFHYSPRISSKPTPIALNEPPFQILLYYCYTPIEDPEGFVIEHRELCERLELVGRILVAKEGVNGTVSGTSEHTAEYMAVLGSDPRFADMPFKIDPSDGHAFPKLSIKARGEVVRLALGIDDVDPNVTTGKRLEPDEWLAVMEEQADDVVILDGRNRYEAALGHFKGAVCPDIENFRDFPTWFAEHREEFEGKRVLTYCTGGIRCEKLSGYLLKEGIEDVSQLEGGIVRYGHDETVAGKNFDGRCYVFDERIVVDVNHTDTNTIVSVCEGCGEKSDRYVNCSLMSCNRQHFLCEACEQKAGRICSDACREAIIQGERLRSSRSSK